MLSDLGLPFVQRGLLEIALLAVAAGLIGTWIVLRGLAFYAHAVGTATFPGLVVADGLGFAALLGAAGTGLAVAVGVAVLTRRGAERHDVATALVLVGALALGVILASDVFDSQAAVEQLLFGSLLLVDTVDLVFAGIVSVLALAGTLLLGARWTAAGFDPSSARALGIRAGWTDAVLLGLVALVAFAALTTLGALLTTALLVVPAATTRLLVDRLVPWQVATVLLVVVEGALGLLIAVETDAPPGATIAVVAAAGFVLAALARLARDHRRAAVAAVAAALALGAAGCGSGDGGGVDAAGGSGSGGDRLAVVATTTQLGDLARQVGGEDVEVRRLLQPNTDPHDYEPRPSDLKALAEADVVLASGDGLDGWIEDAVDRSGSAARVVDVGKGRPVVREPGKAEEEHAHEGEDHAHEEGEGHDHGDTDPHWWQDPVNLAYATGVVAASFGEADQDRQRAFDARGRTFAEEVGAAQRAVQRCIDRVPEGERKLVTDHDAFGYFADRFGLEVVGAVIPSTTTQAQASAGELAELAETIERERVPAIFPARSLNPELAETVAERTGAKVGGELWSDALGPEGSSGATLLTAMRSNADAIVRGLTGGAQGCPA